MKAEALKQQQGMSMVSAFDEYGRCQPNALSEAAHTKTRRYFQLQQPMLDYQAIYQRLNNAFDIADMISAKEFETRIQAILGSLSEDEDSKDILNGVMVPFILPKASYKDIGTVLEAQYLPAVEKAFASVFPKYSFTNHAPKSLAGQLTPSQNSRHDRLIQTMSEEVVVGVYFPCLLEYSIPAAIEQVSKLPQHFLLAGGFDTAAAFISTPDLLLRKDGYPPLLWLSGLSSVEENVGYHFEAYGYDLTFNRRVHLGHVAEYWTSGLTVVG